MNQPFDPDFIERIVQEVIRRLVEQGADIRSAATKEEKELAVSDKVVTLATLKGRLVGVKRVVVGGRSIVTPAVRDELNDRSIELVRR
jgi:hypothetical protein